jgi:hypothetical protein
MELTADSDTGDLYKYMGFEGAKKTLESGAVRFSRPADFNDPFDMSVKEALGGELDEFLGRFMGQFHDFVLGDIDYSVLRPGKFKESIILINQAIKNATPEQREALKEELSRTPVNSLYDLTKLRLLNNDTVEAIQSSMNTFGVFCSTKNHDSLLMWAHYAQAHKGVVLRFLPDKSKDSFFLASRPVKYSKERPLFYRNAAEFIQHSLCMTLFDSTKDIMERLTYTKSTEWEYEKEYRLVIPDMIPEAQTFKTLEF